MSRRPGKNVQAPCTRCTRPAASGLLQPRGNEPVEHLQIHQNRDACEGMGNSQLRSFGQFFSDPASYPSTTQSPVRSPTEFPLLYRSPAADVTAYTSRLQSSFPSPIPGAVGTGNGSLTTYEGLFTATLTTTITPSVPVGGINNTNIYVSVPNTLFSFLGVSPDQVSVSASIRGTCINGGVTIFGATGLFENSAGIWMMRFGTNDIDIPDPACALSVSATFTN